VSVIPETNSCRYQYNRVSNNHLFFIHTNALKRIKLAGWSLLFIIRAIKIAIVKKNAKPMVHALDNKLINDIFINGLN